MQDFAAQAGKPPNLREYYVKWGDPFLAFDLVVLDRGNPTGESTTIRSAILSDGDYRLIGTVPYAVAGSTSHFELWAKR